MRPNLLLLALTLASLAIVLAPGGCGERKPAAMPAQTDDHAHDHGSGGEHPSDKPSGHGHGGAVIALGEQLIGSFNAKATRDEGQIVAGKDSPIDVTVTPAAGVATRAIAVRFWIGTQDARGSVKAKAEIEDPKDPARWHAHAEVPNPLPEGSRLWIEIEDDKGGKSVGSFELHG